MDPKKLYGYLLSVHHPTGRFKARFFASLGYRVDQWHELQADLRDLARDCEAHALGGPTAYGQKYAIRATLKGPNGQSSVVVSVWLVRKGEDFPRLVTAYPGGAP
ncbi:MAG: DUF6883 domain-containing protein [Acidobacteriota bacterium]